jgi:hypothetical protein
VRISQRNASLGGFADLIVLGVDLLPIRLDRRGVDLGRAQLADERS